MAEQYPQQVDLMSEIQSRIRLLESKNSLMRERALVINQNMIDGYKKLTSDIQNFEEETKELKKDLFEIKEIIRHITKELEFFARKDSVRVLEKYINMWNPLNFVTEKEVVKIIEEHKKRGKHAKRKSTTKT